MPRTPRQDFPGARHHVMNRAIRREALFKDDPTSILFLDTLAEVPQRFGARIHGYALMPNHYHLLIEVPRGNLSDVMKHVGGGFTQAFNRRHGHDGPVFRGRFRNHVVEDDAYWMHLVAYLHLNPVKAHLAKAPEDYIWSSHNAYMDKGQAPDWLTRDEVLRLFGSEENVRRYIHEVQIKRREAPDSFDPGRFWSRSATRVVPPPDLIPKRTADQALAEVAKVTGSRLDAVCALPRGRTPNRVGWLTAWWLLRSTELSQRGASEVMGVSRSRMSQLLAKFYKLAEQDEEVRRWRDALENHLP